MKERSKLIIAGVSATLVMASAISSASANRLSISHGGLWEAVWRPLRFRTSGAVGVECPVTIEGSFHSATIRKIERLLIGSVTRASIGPCEIGAATVLSEALPWHVQYLGFLGMLPQIAGVRLILVGVSFRVREVLGRVCLLRSTEAEPVGTIAELEAGTARTVLGLRAEESSRIPCRNNTETITFNFEGSAQVNEVPGGSRNVAIKLI